MASRMETNGKGNAELKFKCHIFLFKRNFRMLLKSAVSQIYQLHDVSKIQLCLIHLHR